MSEFLIRGAEKIADIHVKAWQESYQGIRSKAIFFEQVLWNGQQVPRFKPVVDEEIENFSVSV